MRPCEAETHSQVLKLRSDNTSTKDYWLLLGGDHVTITAQKSGEPATATMDIPRSQFNRLVRWYMTNQKPK